MKMSAQLVSEKPVFLSRAAKLLSRFASVDNGSSGAVPLYLQRTTNAFNHLVQFHSKHKTNDLQTYPDMKRVQKLQRDWENGSPQDNAESRLDEANKKYTKIGQRSDEKTSEIINLENKVPEQEKKENNHLVLLGKRTKTMKMCKCAIDPSLLSSPPFINGDFHN